MYARAPQAQSNAMVVLFGIKYSNEIERSRHAQTAIIEATKLSNRIAYLGVAVHLAQYVGLK
jgi:hypothetical protein